jgi:hypothetical protein
METMQRETVSLAFPTIDLRDLLIPWDKCHGVKLGLVDHKAAQVMEERDYEFAPVFQPVQSGTAVIGLIPRPRLKHLVDTGSELRPDDPAICHPEIYNRPGLDALLKALASIPAALVVEQAGDDVAPLGLLTRSDLNKHPFRSIIYSFLANLEMKLALLVEESFDDHWDWVSHLNEDKQARVIGYWELSKRRGVDVGPVGAATLTEMFTVIAKTDRLRSFLGYTSRKSFDEAVGRIPDLRNQIMHPVRPLITDAESIVKLKEDTATILLLMDRLKERKA